MIAITEAYHTGLLRLNQWRNNILAGLIVGVVALPLAMAFAIASGVTPVQGIYTSIIAGILVALFGGSRVQVAGPTGAFVVLLAAITAKYGVAGLQTATLMAGLLLIGMGALRLGSVIRYIPDPVIAGFTAGIGFIIFFGEWKDFFGLPVKIPLDAHFYQKASLIFQSLPSLNMATTEMAVFSLLLILATPRFFRRVPGPLVAMVAATILQSYFHFDQIITLGTAFGAIPRALPSFHLPALSIEEILELIGPAFTIALLGAIESLLSATAADGMTGARHDSNQELIGQGIANMVTPLFGGFAATGAFARTATSIRNGGTSPIAAIIHSIVLIVIILALAPLAANIPLCTLAAILFVVAYNMSDLPHFRHILVHAPRYDVVVLLVTFILTIFTNLVLAVNIGVILAILFFMQNMIKSITVEQHPPEQIQVILSKLHIPFSAEDVLVYSINGPFFFGAAEKIEHALSVTYTDPKAIVFRMCDVPFIDMTGIETFSELLEQYFKRGVKIYLTEANARVMYKLKKAGVLKWVVKK